MTDTLTTSSPGANTPLEKVPLETYVPPAKPSRSGCRAQKSLTALARRRPAQRKMRLAAALHWMYFRGAKNFDEMTSVSKDMRAELERHFTVDRPEVVAEQISTTHRTNGCRVCRAETSSKAHEVECVYIPKPIAARCAFPSQVGCTLNCSFCHTGTQRLVRNLTAGEDRRPGHGGATASTTGPIARLRPAAASSPTSS
jgi:23S rRNA (adenine2503-C2)-methyltransferase